MDETQYTIDLRTNNGWWARVASWFVGGRLVTPEQGTDRPGICTWSRR
jgi:hypothetical protein